MEEEDLGEDTLPSYLVKRAEGVPIYPLTYTMEQLADFIKISEFYLALCGQYEPEEKKMPPYLILSKNKCTELYAQGYCPVTDFLVWKNCLEKKSPFYHALIEIVGYLCEAQLSVMERLVQPGYHYDAASMLFEECKAWAVGFSRLNEFEAGLCEKLKMRRLFLAEVLNAEKLLLDVPEYAKALLKCINKIDENMLPRLKAILVQHASRQKFLDFEKTIQDTMKYAILFIFHVFRCTPYEATGSCNISELQDFFSRSETVIGKACSSIMGKQLLTLVSTWEMRKIFQEKAEQSLSGSFLKDSEFVDEEGHIVLPKRWEDEPREILPAFMNNPDWMRQFMYLHALTKKIALFHVMAQDFLSLHLDCRYVLNEMREAMDAYKTLHRQWKKCIDYLYALAQSYLASAKYMPSSPDIECWREHFSAVRNFYSKFEGLVLQVNAFVYEIERDFCEVESVVPKNDAKFLLRGFYGFVEGFNQVIKAPLIQDSNVFLFSGVSTPSTTPVTTPVATPTKTPQRFGWFGGK